MTPDFMVIFVVKVSQAGSTRRANGLRGVATVPSGKTAIAPPQARYYNACFQVFRWSVVASLVPSREIGSRERFLGLTKHMVSGKAESPIRF